MFLEELAEVRKELKGIQREIKQLNRHIAWNRVIDSAIHLCRVLAKAEADAAKFNPNWAAQPRVPK